MLTWPSGPGETFTFPMKWSKTSVGRSVTENWCVSGAVCGGTLGAEGERIPKRKASTPTMTAASAGLRPVSGWRVAERAIVKRHDGRELAAVRCGAHFSAGGAD